MRLLFLALALMNAWRFHKTRDRWFLGLGVLFGLAAFRREMPEPVYLTALGVVVLWVLWLAAWKFVPALRIRRAFGNPKLRSLGAEEREWRGKLTTTERGKLETWEMLVEKRFTMAEAIAFLENQRESKPQSVADIRHAAEKAAYEAEQRAEAAEQKEMEVTAVSSPMELVSSDGARVWVKLDTVEDLDEDDAFRAPIRCTTWAVRPAANDAGKVSFTSLAEAIHFPPNDSIKRSFWESASGEFKRMFRSRCLVAGIDVADDGRERFDFQIEDRSFVIMTKYLGWRTDLALDDDSQRVWIRISGMNSEVWSAPDDDGASQFDDFARIPAFLYAIPADRLMSSVRPNAHFESIDRLLEGEE